MTRKHPEVRLNRTPFTKEWEVVRIAKDGRTITDRWPIHADDAAVLDEWADHAATRSREPVTTPPDQPEPMEADR